MPIYEYACQKCGHEFEALQKGSEGALKKCPQCGALRLKRLVSAPSFHLKGTGWYETDFKKDGKRKPADSADEKPAAVATSKEGSDSGATEKKTEAGTEASTKASTEAKVEKTKPEKNSKPSAPAAD